MHVTDYCGTYRAVVVDNKDPKGLGRLKLMVPQVLGEQVTDWAWPVTGGWAQAKTPYGTFSSTSTQPVAGVNTATVVTFNTPEDVNYTSIKDNSKITVAETGDYFFQFSAQFASSGSSSVQADIWLRKNGVDIPRTNSRVTLQGNPNEVLATLNYILDLKANDYVQVVFSSADSGVKLISHSSLSTPARPNIPSIIASVNLVGKYVPKAKQGVWATFEGGNPNFPLWIGAF